MYLSSVTPDLGGKEARWPEDFPHPVDRFSAEEVVAPPGGCSMQERGPALDCLGAPGWEVGGYRQFRPLGEEGEAKDPSF